MSIINNSRLVIQGLVTRSGRLGGKIAIIFKEKVELFATFDGESKLGINFNFESIKKNPVAIHKNIPPKTTDPAGVANKAGKILPHLTPILFASGSFIIALQVGKAIYKNNNKKRTKLWCNVPIPVGYRETNDFEREFQIEYLFPLAIFPQEDYLEKISVKSGMSQLEVFYNFVYYRTVIVRLADRLCYVIISLLFFGSTARFSRVILSDVLGSAIMRKYLFATEAMVYSVAIGLTGNICVIITTVLAFIINGVFFIIKFIIVKIKTKNFPAFL